MVFCTLKPHKILKPICLNLIEHEAI